MNDEVKKFEEELNEFGKKYVICFEEEDDYDV